MTRLEHINLTVPDINAAIDFIRLVAPDFSIRKDSLSERGYRWVHIGNDQCYFALQEPHLESSPQTPLETYINFGVNHIGIIIDNAKATEKVLLANGYKSNGGMLIESYRKRLYFFDRSGFEWEMVEYLSPSAADRYLFE